MVHPSSLPQVRHCFPTKAAALFLVGCLLIAGLPISAAADGTSESEEIIFLSNEKPNLFVGMFDHYQADPNYVEALRRMWPNDQDRFFDGMILMHLSQLLTLYLANLEDEGYHFGVIEREDLCTESFYVVELTEGGESVIQIAFSISQIDPKYPWIMTLGCEGTEHLDEDTLNRYLNAMWIAYDTLNIHMTDEKYESMMEHSEVSRSDAYGAMLRGQYDGLGYMLAIGSEVYLIISPDLSISVFQGLSTD